MVEYQQRYTSHASSAYATVESGADPAVLATWNGAVPFDNAPAGRGPLRSASNPDGDVALTFASVHPPPVGHTCVEERLLAVYLWTPRVVTTGVTAPAGWTVTTTGPYGEAVPRVRGRGLIVLTAPEEHEGLTVTLGIATPIMRIRGLTGMHDPRDPVGSEDADDGGGDDPPIFMF